MHSFKFPPAVDGLECIHQGKVRDTFAIPGRPDLLLTVATDRISTHNVVHLNTIPLKGQTLTALTVFWMTKLLSGIKTHLVAYGKNIYNYLPAGAYPADLHLRAIIIQMLNMFPVEFIFRSRMAGSLWKDYYSKGLLNPYGLDLPSGLMLMSPFGKTEFTPTDKSETDDPLDSEETAKHYRGAYRLSLEVYEIGRSFAQSRGIEIIDGKFETGTNMSGEAILGDECLTPDACRFVKADEIVVGREPNWLDKEYARHAAEAIWAGGKKIPLTFGPSTRHETTMRYNSIFRTLTGDTLEHFQQTYLESD